MLYDKNDNMSLMNIYQPEKLNIKKVVIFAIVAILCLAILVGSFAISYSRINSNNSQYTSAEITEVTEENENTHTQIAPHNSDKIKEKFIPEYNENALQEIKDLYYSTEKVAYLTFDDGPSANITPQILDILAEEDVPATFFLIGSRVELYPSIVQREYNEGHYLANHSYSHKYSEIYQSADTVFGEYIDCENAVREALSISDYQMFLFRFPGGSSGGVYDDVKREAKSLLSSYGVAYTNWNCMTGDAEGSDTVEEQLETLKETMEGDDTIIVLMHDASDKQTTVDALPQIISYLREQGYTFKNFYEIF